MEGSIAQGMSEMKSFIDIKTKKEFAFLLEKQHISCILFEMNLQNDPDGLQHILNDIETSNNLLLNFAACRLASKLGKNDLAISILENRKQTSSHYPFWYLEYLLGICKQNKLTPMLSSI